MKEGDSLSHATVDRIPTNDVFLRARVPAGGKIRHRNRARIIIIPVIKIAVVVTVRENQSAMTNAPHKQRDGVFFGYITRLAILDRSLDSQSQNRRQQAVMLRVISFWRLELDRVL
jgi:hypothetical protein